MGPLLSSPLGVDDWKRKLASVLDSAATILVWSSVDMYGSMAYHKTHKPLGWKERQLIDWRMKSIPIRECMAITRSGVRLPYVMSVLRPYHPDWKDVSDPLVLARITGYQRDGRTKMQSHIESPYKLSYPDGTIDPRTGSARVRKTTWKPCVGAA
jgi:hypothetical protein